MEALVTFTYQVGYVPPKCHNTRSAHFRGRTAVEIAELARADAAPAFRVASGSNRRFAALEGRPRLVVAHAGRLWAEHGALDVFRALLAAEPPVEGTPFDAAKRLAFTGYDGNRRLLASDTPASLRRQCGELRRLEDDGGAAKTLEIQRRARDILIIGDTVFVRTCEPIWRAANGRLAVSAAPADPGEPFADSGDLYLGSHSACWRADRRDEALASAGKPTGAGPVADGGDEVIEVLDPAYVRFADDSRALAAAAGWIAATLSEHLAAMPRWVVERFYDIREALAATGGRNGPAVVAAVSSFAADGADGPAAEDAAAALARAWEISASALDRWDRRPADGREWQHLGLPLTATLRPNRAGSVREVLDLEAAGVLARAVGADLAWMEQMAAGGRARLLAVDGKKALQTPTSQAAVLVVDRDGMPEVAGSVVREGLGGPEPFTEAAIGHLRQAAGAGLPDDTAPQRGPRT